MIVPRAEIDRRAWREYAQDYALHFPPCGLPANAAFWSLTMTGVKRAMVATR